MEHTELLSSRLATNETSSPLQREIELLRDGLTGGAKQRVQEICASPLETAADLGLCAVVGYGLTLMSRAGGRWGTGAKILSSGFALAAAYDVLRRGAPTTSAIVDTWSSPKDLDANKQIVGVYAGSALIDYPIMIAAGYGGHKLGGLTPFRTPVAPIRTTLLADELRDVPSAPALEIFSKFAERRLATLMEAYPSLNSKIEPSLPTAPTDTPLTLAERKLSKLLEAYPSLNAKIEPTQLKRIQAVPSVQPPAVAESLLMSSLKPELPSVNKNPWMADLSGANSKLKSLETIRTVIYSNSSPTNVRMTTITEALQPPRPRLSGCHLYLLSKNPITDGSQLFPPLKVKESGP